MSVDSHRPSKKRKPSSSNDNESTAASSSQQQLAPVEKSTTFWFEDGNIILRTTTKMYRVHRGVLSLHSTVFRDMFSLPQPPDQQSTFEGVPVVDLTDSARDWDLLLPVIYGLEGVQALGSTHISPPLLIAMLRLGRKYDFDRFKRPALKQLKAYFPDELNQLDTSAFGTELSTAMFPHLFELTQIAMELNIQRALPTAFFRCVSECDTELILDGRDSPEGPVYLLPEVQKKLVLGKEALIRESAEEAMGWFFEPTLSPGCSDIKGCTALKQKEVTGMASDPTPFFALYLSHIVDLGAQLCRDCVREVSERHKSGRKNTFRKLPTIFGLEPWDKLVDDL